MISKTVAAYFKAAKAMSELSDHCQHKIGCVVVRGHRIISSGCNSQKRNHSLQARLDEARYGIRCPGYKHAEIDALLPLMRKRVDLSNAILYVYREHKNGNLAMARPCESCQEVIKSLGIRRVFYTIENGYAVEKI